MKIDGGKRETSGTIVLDSEQISNGTGSGTKKSRQVHDTMKLGISACLIYHFNSQACLQSHRTFREVTDLLTISFTLGCNDCQILHILAHHMYINLIPNRGC